MASFGRSLKRWLPASLFGRALLILLLPILALQAVVALLFLQRHYDGVTEQMAQAVAREIDFTIGLVDAAPSLEAARAIVADSATSFAIELGLDEGAVVSRGLTRDVFDLTGESIADTFRRQIGRPMSIDLVTIDKQVDARIQTSKGVLRVLVPRRRVNPSNPHLLLVWMGLTAAALTGVAVVFLRNQVRPIRELARAAVAFGRGRSLPFRPSGAEEVRRAGAAFVDMRSRIERQIEQRTRMLTGVSHDLRTPLTRIRLALAVGEETAETAEIARDVAEMERMLEGFLAFARGEAGEAVGPVDPVALAEEVVGDARRQGAEIRLFSEVMTPGAREVDLRRQSIKRCLANLVENAITYGATVAVSVRLGPQSVEFLVEDDGPGVPEADREAAMRPFVRLEAGRSQNIASGVGLGLSIALDAARSHGGSLVLGASQALGGLAARVTLPR